MKETVTPYVPSMAAKKPIGRPPKKAKDRVEASSISFDKSQLAALRRIAKSRNVTLSQVVRDAVADWLKRKRR